MSVAKSRACRCNSRPGLLKLAAVPASCCTKGTNWWDRKVASKQSAGKMISGCRKGLWLRKGCRMACFSKIEAG